jgi:type I restriction enzyme S subunit
MGGLSDPYVGETRRTLTDVGLADCSASLLPAGSVILSSRAPIGHVILNTVPMATNQGCKSMIPRNDLDAKFLFYFIKANVPLLESLGTGATFKELSGGKLASVEIPLPPLAEQKRIVALLDEAFAGIDEAKAKAEAAQRASAKIFESQVGLSFAENSTWKEATLSDLGKTLTGTTPPTANPEYYGEYIPFVKPADFNEDGT